eukprot:scaffold4390_cov264-Pinguiococcus_pyrenoidosus.AAC.6
MDAGVEEPAQPAAVVEPEAESQPEPADSASGEELTRAVSEVTAAESVEPVEQKAEPPAAGQAPLTEEQLERCVSPFAHPLQTPEDDTPRWATSLNRSVDDFDALPDESQSNEPLELFEDEIIPLVDELPPWASEEAKALDVEIKRNEKLLARLDQQVADNAERVRVMKEHMSNVQQEVQHTNGLVAAKAKENETERHFRELALREAARYRGEQQFIEKGIQKSREQLNSAQNEIFKASEKLDDFKLRMDWNQEELEQWSAAEKQKEEDTFALEKYTRADESRIKELMLRIETLTREHVSRKKQLTDETTETQARQIELDKAATEFRKLHAERQGLISQWQDAIDTMKQRDGDINQIGEKYAEVKRSRMEKLEKLQEAQAILKAQIEQNSEVESNSNGQDRMIQRRRQELLEGQQRLSAFKDELDVMKNELESGATSLSKRRHEVQQLEAEVAQKTSKLQAERKQYKQWRENLELERGRAETSEQSAQKAEHTLKMHEMELVNLERKLKTKKEAMFRCSQHLFALRQEEANLIAEIAGARSNLRSIAGKVTDLDNKALRQQELLYNAEFQIQQMERKVARGLGERTDDEKRVLNAQIEALEKELTDAVNQRKMLAQQCRRLNNELRIALRVRTESENEQLSLKNRIAELELENGTAERQLGHSTERRNQAMVQHDVMRLELKRLRDMLTKKADEVFSLENRKQQLELSMEERKAEILVHQDVQRAQLRAAEDERHKISVELAQRKQQVAVRRAKYDTIAGDSKQEEQSQAFYLIQTAQKREELQRTGDNLDFEIRKIERDIRALHVTLKDLQQRNTAYRMSFQKADPRSTDAQELASLEAQLKAEQDHLFHKKKQFQRLATDGEEDELRLKQVVAQTGSLNEQRLQLETSQAQLSEEIGAKDQEVAELSEQLTKLRVEHREACNLEKDVESTQEKVFRKEMLHDTAGLVLYTLGHLSKQYPEIEEFLKQETTSLGFTIPTAPPDSLGNILA